MKEKELSQKRKEEIEAQAVLDYETRHIWTFPFLTVAFLIGIAFLVSLFGTTSMVCMVGIGGFALIYFQLYKPLTELFVDAVADRHRNPKAMAYTKIFYMYLGITAALLKLFADLVMRFAGSTYQKWTLTGVVMILSTVLGIITKVNDPLAPGFSARAVKFIWSFEFCRALLIFICGLWGAESFKAVSVILASSDTILGIPVGVPLWFLSVERRVAALQLHNEIGPLSFYTLFAAAPAYRGEDTKRNFKHAKRLR